MINQKLVQYGIDAGLTPDANVFTQQIFFLNSFMKTTTEDIECTSDSRDLEEILKDAS